MNIAALQNIPVDDKTLQYFSFPHSDNHFQIVKAVFLQSGQIIDLPVLDPLPMFALQNWLYTHQQIHNQTNSILGIAGNDLSTVDLNDPEELTSWINLNFSEHQQAMKVLGIS